MGLGEIGERVIGEIDRSINSSFRYSGSDLEWRYRPNFLY
jgi:hypothetical protein